MAIALGGNQINKAYLGTTEIHKMYLGSDLVFDNSVQTKTVGWTDETALENRLPHSNMRGGVWAMPEDGLIKTISVWHDDVTTTNNLQLGIYADSANSPGALIMTTEVLTDTNSGWNVGTLTTPYQATAGQVLWFCYSGIITSKYDSIPGESYRASADQGGLQIPLPDPFGTSGVAEYTYAVYATYETGGTTPTGTTPILSNFNITNAEPTRINFDASEDITGMTSTGFVISGKTISGNPTISVGGLSGYFTVTEAFNFWNNNTIRLGENSDKSDVNPSLYNFTLEYIENNIDEPSANTYRYVTTSASGGGDGLTEGTAWTWAEADGNATEGMTVWVKAGNYGRVLNITLANNGTASNPIKFIGYKDTIGDTDTNYLQDYNDIANNWDDTAMPSFTGVDPDLYGDELFFITGDYIILRNMQSRNYYKSMQGSPNYTVIDNFNSKDNFFDGTVSGCGILFRDDTNLNSIRVQNTMLLNHNLQGLTIQGNNSQHHLYNNVKSYNDNDDSSGTNNRQDYHISFNGSNSIMTNCYAENINDTASNGSTHGIGVRGDTVYDNKYNLIEKSTSVNSLECFYIRNYGGDYNVIKDCFATRTHTGGYTGDVSGGIWLWGGVDYNVVERNKIINVSWGIGFRDNQEEPHESVYVGTGNIIRNNIIEDTKSAMYFTSSEAGADLIDTYFYSNTVNDADYLLYSPVDPIKVDIIDFYIKNNSFTNVSDLLNVYITATPFTFDYNNFFSPTTSLGTNVTTVDPGFDSNYLPSNELLMSGIATFECKYDYNKKQREAPTTTLGAVTLTSEDAGGEQPPVTDIDYYVSTSGTGSGVGSEVDPLTLSQITSVGLTTGDVMAFKRGDVFVGVTDFNLLSGVTFTAYGTGALPILTSVIEYNLNWSDQGGNVWQTTDVDRQVKRMKIDGVEVLSAGSLGELGTNIPDLTEFYWSGSSLSVYSTDSPANHTLEFSSHLTAGGTYYNHTLGFTNSSDITINNISFQGGYFETVKFDNHTGATMTDCILGEMCFNGIAIEGASSNIVIQNNDLDSKFTLDYSGAAVGASSARGAADCVRFQQCNVADVSNNTFVNWQHTSVSMTSQSQEIITGIKVYLNACTIPNLPYGGSITTDGLNVHTNEIYSNTLDGVKGVQFNGHDNHFHDNIVNNSKQSTIHSYTTGEGLGMQNYYEACYNNIVEDNTFENCDDAGVFISGNNYGGDVTGNIVRRNSFINCGSGGSNKGIRIDTDASTGSNYGNSYIDNNIYNDSETLTVRYRNTDMTVSIFNSSTGSPENNTISGNTANV